MYRNVLTIAKVTICNIALAGLLTGCGTMVDLELDTPARGNEVVESKESKEEETEETKEIEETTESEATFKTEVVEPTSEIELTTETNVVEESKEELTTEATTESSGFKVVVDSTSGVNAGYIVSDEKEYEQTYIAYEDMETVTMYVIAYSDMYADFNATEGAFRIEGYVYEGDEFNIDGKVFLTCRNDPVMICLHVRDLLCILSLSYRKKKVSANPPDKTCSLRPNP